VVLPVGGSGVIVGILVLPLVRVQVILRLLSGFVGPLEDVLILINKEGVPYPEILAKEEVWVKAVEDMDPLPEDSALDEDL